MMPTTCRLALLVLLVTLVTACSSGTVFMGYGRGETMEQATRAAWANAQEKLQISNLPNHTLIEEKMVQTYTGEAQGHSFYDVTIRFRAKPLDTK